MKIIMLFKEALGGGIKVFFRAGSLRVSHENLGNSSKNRSIILGGQVDTNCDDDDDGGH